MYKYISILLLIVTVLLSACSKSSDIKQKVATPGGLFIVNTRDVGDAGLNNFNNVDGFGNSAAHIDVEGNSGVHKIAVRLAFSYKGNTMAPMIIGGTTAVLDGQLYNATAGYVMLDKYDGNTMSGTYNFVALTNPGTRGFKGRFNLKKN